MLTPTPIVLLPAPPDIQSTTELLPAALAVVTTIVAGSALVRLLSIRIRHSAGSQQVERPAMRPVTTEETSVYAGEPELLNDEDEVCYRRKERLIEATREG